MNASLIRLILVAAFLALPGTGYAQEAVISGTVVDTTGGVLPGVTITAVQEDTGNTFLAVTDERGAFRMPVRVGAYRITLELPGFQTITRTGLTLLAGQTLSISLEMAPSALEETVTVTGEAPLVRFTETSVAGNIDPRQVQELPVEGRNWMALLLVAPGSRTSSTDANAPLSDRGGGSSGADQRFYQTNIDGQQVSNSLGGGRQPLFSQEMIAEMQFVANRFDATQGRSLGVQVNVITRSGTNRYSGSVRGNFRDDRFNAANPVLGRVVPIKEQQIASTFGGPIMRDRVHFFAYQDYGRIPGTGIWNTPYPVFNVTRDNLLTTKQGGLRLDYQFSPQTRFMLKGDLWRNWNEGMTGGSGFPGAAATTRETGNVLNLQLTRVLSNRSVNELKGGYSGYYYFNTCHTTWSNHWYRHDGPYGPVTECGPVIQFTGFTFGGNQGYPRHRGQDRYWVRNDFTFSYDARGRHDLRAGGEFLYHTEMSANCTACRGLFSARGRPAGLPAIPTPAQLQEWFPDPFNVDTWNLNAINPWIQQLTIGIHAGRRPSDQQNLAALWVQDDWRVTNRLTLNLGARWDLQTNAFANEGDVPPFMRPGRPDDWKNIAPRVGAAYALNDSTVIRGGTGLYYAEHITSQLLYALEYRSVIRVEVPNDGRPDFATNPFNGPRPTYEEALLRFCYYNNNAPGCLQRVTQELAPPLDYQRTQYTWQSTVGFSRQLAGNMAIEADYLYNAGRGEKIQQQNINLQFDPVTGVNLPYNVVANRPYPTDGVIGMTPFIGKSNYHALSATFTKRMSNGWQAQATYLLSGLWSGQGRPLMGVTDQEPIQTWFDVAPDIFGEYGLDGADQRHRLVVNGIWNVWRGFQLSGYHYLGAGNRSSTNYGGDLRNLGVAGEARLRPDGTIVPRNSFIQPMQNRTNVRFQQRIPIPNRVQLDLMAEAFNLFNRPNYTLGTQESSLNYGQRISAQYRTWQFGFRTTF